MNFNEAFVFHTKVVHTFSRCYIIEKNWENLSHHIISSIFAYYSTKLHDSLGRGITHCARTKKLQHVFLELFVLDRAGYGRMLRRNVWSLECRATTGMSSRQPGVNEFWPGSVAAASPSWCPCWMLRLVRLHCGDLRTHHNGVSDLSQVIRSR